MRLSEPIIRTVCGNAAPTGFDFFHCHDHLWINRNKLGGNSPVKPIDNREKSEAEVLLLAGRKPNALIVDCQPISAGGSRNMLKKISLATGVGFVSSTGFHKLCFYRNDSPIFSEDSDGLAERFVSEIKRGCGIIKTAVEKDGVSGRYTALHTAAVKASLKTGAKIICHIDSGADPVDVLHFYTSMGVSADSMIICHCDRAVSDLSLHEQIASEGAYLEYDTVGRFKYHSDEDEIKIIRRICDKGLGDRILLGLDTTAERLKCYSGENAVGLTYLADKFYPLMLDNGISKREAENFIKNNPRRALAYVPALG